MLQPLELLPGVLYPPTKASFSTAWRETNLIRWIGGKLRPIRGWAQLDYSTAFASPIRRIYSWSDNNTIRYIAYLCEQHLYVEQDGVLVDISPTVPITAPASVFEEGGYGDGTYGYDTYGTPRPAAPTDRGIMPTYTLGNWGQQLLAMTSADGRLLFWDPTVPASIAAPVTDAPTGNRTFVVTPERHVMLFGTDGERHRFAWSDQENYSDWEYAVITSKAGFFDVEPASPIVTAINTIGGVLFWTAAKTYQVRSVGIPYIYAYDELGDSATPVSAMTPVNTALGAYWFSESGFWHFNGSSVEMINCPLWSWVRENISEAYSRSYSFGMNNSPRSEYWWFFCSEESETPDKYVIFNYREGWWSMGTMSRTAAGQAGYEAIPVMANNDVAYRHEEGFVYPGSPELPWAETHAINVGSGVRMATFDQMMPDIGGDDAESIGFQLYYQDERTQQGVEKTSAVKTVRSDGRLDFRLTGRDFRLRIAAQASNIDWTVGQNLIDVKPRGKK